MLCVFSVEAAVRLPRLISDGMVLQRDTEIKLWGWADKGEKINILFSDKSFDTKADKSGNWHLLLPAQKAGGPYDLKINEITIKDVLIGDVWVCSGQSNMELPIRRVLDLYGDEIKQANNPLIRQFKVPLRYDFTNAQVDLEGGSWKPVTPENALDFSAVAYFFAQQLYEKYNVPIGLINSAVGGSPIEAWISEDALKHFPTYLAEAQKCAEPGYMEKIRSEENRKQGEWQSTLNSKDAGFGQWYKNDINASDWKSINLPGYWADQLGENVNGVFWFRKEVEIPSSMLNKSATIRLGCIVDSDSTFINGKFVGNITYMYPPRTYNIPVGVLKEGKNTVTVRVVNSSGRGGFVEDKPFRIETDNERVDLGGEWKYKMGTQMPQGPSQTFFQYKPMGLYNGMISPLINYAVKGAIWYQGESNTGRVAEYGDLFSSMINDWRSKWKTLDLPFIYAQLPNFMQVQDQPSDGGWARLREVQMQSLKIPNTGMAVISDIGEWNDIHPLNKKDVGRRLALSAMNVAYNDNSVVGSAPIYDKMEVRGKEIVLSFTKINRGFKTGEVLKGFAIAGEDKVFVWAKARIEGDKVIVWSDKIENPIAVRYAWADNPQGANLKSKNDLPCSPFRTDSW